MEDSREYRFVQSVFKALEDKAKRSAMRRADNPATEYQCWEFLLRHHIDIEKDAERLAATLVCASIARGKQSQNGTLKVPEALAQCYPDGAKSSAAEAKLRRLCACVSTEEFVEILRPMLRLIEGRTNNIDYVDLYTFLRKTQFDDVLESVKRRWVKNFYHQTYDDRPEEIE